MKLNDNNFPESSDDEDEGEGRSGQSGKVHFRYKDAMSVVPRDDAVSEPEAKRLLGMHEELHKAQVVKQRITRQDRLAAKEGRLTLAEKAGKTLQAGRGGGGSYSPYKQHPISRTAQFSGIDRQVIAVPSENRAETNDDPRNELENRLELRNTLQNTPKFNPKPRPSF